ncbi:hypothetical protein HMPREF3218_0201462 [Prevotella bivia]|uniref:Uncharacterized protein n=1 Tax=Prevotella bivia TaxID=28125 RepID=A0A137SYZ1_9BACT|nr:hypothetical protein HMPREF3202_00938 [Prevotella bivia]KXU57486.1 hypothetical protein HMPREF3218_0201462 [Prevotella bivia]
MLFILCKDNTNEYNTSLLEYYRVQFILCKDKINVVIEEIVNRLFVYS